MNEEEAARGFRDKPRFVVLGTLGKQWIVEVYNIFDELKGRLVFQNKAELLQGFDESIPDDEMDMNFEEN